MKVLNIRGYLQCSYCHSTLGHESTKLTRVLVCSFCGQPSDEIDITAFTLPNGKRIAVFTGPSGNEVAWQRYEGESWQPFDPKLLEFTPADKLVRKEKTE